MEGGPSRTAGTEVTGDQDPVPTRTGLRPVRDLHATQLVALLAMSPLAAGAIALLQHWGYAARLPLWVLPTIFVLATFGALAVNALWAARPSRVTLHLRAAVQAAGTGAVIYAIGWGPTLGIGFVVVGQETLALAGPDAVNIVTGWSLAFLGLGELSLALGWAPSMVSVSALHGLAVLMALGLVFAFRAYTAALRHEQGAMEQLEGRERRFRSLVQHSHDLLLIMQRDGVITYASPSAIPVLGYEPADLRGPERPRFVHDDDLEVFRTLMQRTIEHPGETHDFLVRVEHRTGTWRWLEGAMTDLTDDAAIGGIVVNARDVTARHDTESRILAREQQQAMLAELGRIAVGDIATEPLLRRVVEAVAQTAPVESCAVLEHAGAHLLYVHASLGTDVAAGTTLTAWPTDVELVTFPITEGVRDWGALAVSTSEPLGDDDRHFLQTVANLLASVLERRRVEDTVRHQALHDSLTGLPNRALFSDRVEHAIAVARREGTLVALLLLDLNGFKSINDTLGHPIGDEVLTAIARRLDGSVREADTVARLGGDEFAVLAHDLRSVEDAQELAAKLGRRLDEPLVVRDMRLNIGASIGIALFPNHADDGTTLLQRADVAMYEAKHLNQGDSVYSAGNDPNTVEHLALAAQLRTGIEGGELVVHYQPIVRLSDGHPVGIEALVRWQHPELGLLAPDRFIPLAEHSGLIRLLTATVMQTAIPQLARWLAQGFDLRLALNISARTLHDSQLGELLTAELAAAGVPAERVVLEITETAITTNPAGALAVLENLAASGVRIALDDFGTGFCSLAYLRQLPIHELKIDKSFVTALRPSTRDAVLVHSIVELGNNLGLTVCAEGVEDARVRDQLRDAGAGLGQGYLFSPALPAAELERWLHEAQAAPGPDALAS
jgi:diguanylate cyclase (GGDEF)-like protein/PAS domain S-box-containing protein